MKATLTFNLPDDEFSFINATKADTYCFVIDEIKSYLRNTLKYSELTDVEYKAIQKVQSDILQLINER